MTEARPANPAGLLENPGIHWAFSASARSTPQAVALTDGDSQWSYSQLDAMANGIAQGLISAGIKVGDRVGVCAERSARLVAGILGVLKAGACYVPLDPDYPLARLNYLIGDSLPKAILVQEETRSLLAAPEGPVLLSIEDLCDLDGQAPSDPEVAVGPDSSAYVIYTSGSTGPPKGVEVTHGNVLRLFSSTDPWFCFGPEDVWTLFHSFSFDFSVWEIWGALLFGGRLVIVPHLTSRSPRDFRDLLLREGVTVLNQTPSAFLQLQEADRTEGDLLPLRSVIFGGEALRFGSLAPWMDKYGDTSPQLINMYGITETTVHVTYRRVLRGDVLADEGSFVGIPIPDLSLHILDPSGQPSATGEAGELFVGGGGVAKGYLGQPDLTAQRFVPNPFGTGRLYRTGDKVRATPQGDLEYLGRLDNQIQLRGFRIELGEVADCLSHHSGILEAVALLREDRPGDPRLVAYFVPVPGAFPKEAELDEHLRTHLPPHMVPNHLVKIDALPLTPHGKVDRDALPAPSSVGTSTEVQEPNEGRTSGSQGTHEPQSDLESLLVDVWREVLGSEEMGAQSDFFLKGGHSLLATQAMDLVEAELGLKIPFRLIFQFSTPETLAKAMEDWIEGENRDGASPNTPGGE